MLSKGPLSGASRPYAIGLLLNDLSVPNTSLWHGALDAAGAHSANLLCFACTSGVTLESLKPDGRPSLYNLARAESLDGLIIWSGALNAFISKNEIQELCESYRPLPMVSIALALNNIPSLILDNRSGMRLALEHLIQVHGYRRIALIRGPEGHQEADVRFQTYIETLFDYGIPFDPLLCQPGSFDPEDGDKAVQRLVDELGLHFEALLTMDDSVALSAMKALKRRGLKVPKDIAVVGFDDQAFSAYTNPPLTTVRISTYEQGWQAVELILAQLEGHPVPPQVPFNPRLVVRESCGCISSAVAQAAAGTTAWIAGDFRKNLAKDHQRILLDIRNSGIVPPTVSQWLEAWVDAFIKEICRKEGLQTNGFLSVVRELLQDSPPSPDQTAGMDALLSGIRRAIVPYLGSHPKSVTRAEDLWQQARILIAQAANRAEANERLLNEEVAVTLLQINEVMVASLSYDQLMDEIALEFPRVDIRSCYVSLYRDPIQPSSGAVINLAYEDGQRLELEPDKTFFLPSQLTPNMRWRSRDAHWVVQPLNYNHEQMGFVVFQAGTRQGIVYEALRGQLSSALKGAQLHAELSLTDSLTKVHNRRYFDIILQKEVERSRRYDRNLALIMIDTDYFKKYNDLFGHLAGDDALRLVAECIQSGVRRGLDVVVRYGGDEFAVILSETDAAGAAVVADHIRLKLKSDPCILGNLTLSFGVASQKGEKAGIKRLISEADQALYQAKNKGRDQIMIYTDEFKDSQQNLSSQ